MQAAENLSQSTQCTRKLIAERVFPHENTFTTAGSAAALKRRHDGGGSFSTSAIDGF